MGLWLVTGGTGFLGRHVLSALAAAEPPGCSEIVALGKHCPPGWASSAFARADLEDADGLVRAMATIEPSVVIHAAGKTPPAPPDQLFQVNTRATLQLLAALRARNCPVRVVLAGSAAELGPVQHDHLPVSEEHTGLPHDAYGLSKWIASLAGLASGPPLDVSVARIFNVIGPGMPPSQAFGRFAAQLSSPGPDPIRLMVGDLDSRRDFVDVRDVARALIALALRGRRGLAYHVGSGRSHRVGGGLEHLIRLSGRAVLIESDHTLTVSSGPRDSCADTRRITAHTGWVAQVNWVQSLADLWDEVRARPRLPLTPAPSPV